MCHQSPKPFSLKPAHRPSRQFDAESTWRNRNDRCTHVAQRAWQVASRLVYALVLTVVSSILRRLRRAIQKLPYLPAPPGLSNSRNVPSQLVSGYLEIWLDADTSKALYLLSIISHLIKLAVQYQERNFNI
ncbi:hypothetical protein FBULB1_841 [Fusarium bulbicola]|nr:hypothetical protein FBULB1_841 [Fusarium bulbicola]